MNGYLKQETKYMLRCRLTKFANIPPIQANEYVDAYEKFLSLKIALKDFNCQKLAAPPGIDKVWRLHALDTHNYTKDCEDLCGNVMHYDLDDDGNFDRQNATKIAYEMKYHSEPIGEMWNFSEKDRSMLERGERIARDGNGNQKRSLETEEGDGNQSNVIVAKKQREAIEVDAVKYPDIFEIKVQVSDGSFLTINVTADNFLQDVFDLIIEKGEYKFDSNDDWEMVDVDGKPIDYDNFQCMATIGDVIAVRLESWEMNIIEEKYHFREWDIFRGEVSLIPEQFLLPTYDIYMSSVDRDFEVKINREKSMKDILEALPCNPSEGQWRQPEGEEEDPGKRNLEEHSTRRVVFRKWRGEQIKITVQNPLTNEELVLSASKDMTGKQFRRLLQQEDETITEGFRMLFNGDCIFDDQPLSYCGLQDGSEVEIFYQQVAC